MRSERIANHSIIIDREIHKVHVLLLFHAKSIYSPQNTKHFINNRYRRYLLPRCLWRWLFVRNKITVHHQVQCKLLHNVSIHNTKLTDLLTHSTEQSRSWEANRFSDSQEIPCILWNLKVHYHIHKCPCPYPEPVQSSPYPHIPLTEDPS